MMLKFNLATMNHVLIVLLPVMLLIHTAFAQSGTGDITGTVLPRAEEWCF